MAAGTPDEVESGEEAARRAKSEARRERKRSPGRREGEEQERSEPDEG